MAVMFKTTANAFKKEIRDPADPAFTITTLYEQFDAFGNARKATVSASGVASRVTQYQYDPKGRFATRVTNTLGQHTHYTYDGRWGQPLSVTDITGRTATSQYDAFGRLKSATDALNHTSTTAMVWDVGAQSSAVYRMDNQSPGAPVGKTWFDAHNRELRSETEGYSGPVASTKRYDARGRTEEGTMPSPQSTGAAQPIVQTMAYDNLNRLENVSDGTRTTGSTFGMVGNTYRTTVTDPGGRQRKQRVDIHGRVVRTDDPAGYLTFEYDVSGRLKKTKGYGLDGNGTTLTEMEYDLLGHQTLLKDVDAGETHYVHNPFGELTSQTDANGHTHTMQYDNMGRITGRTGPDGTTTYQYVTNGNGLNQIKKVTAPNGTMKEYAYDGLDRLASLKETVGDKTFTTAYTYDSFGRVKDITYPTGFTVTHTYDQHGYMTTVSHGSTAIFTAGATNAYGQLTEYSLGNGKTTTRTYTDLGIPESVRTPNVLEHFYAFDPATGNLLWRTDEKHGLTEDFTYDDLHRLTEGEQTASPQFSPYVPDIVVEYDANGNILEKSDVGEYSYDSDLINAVTSITNPDVGISLETQDITYTEYGRRTETIFEGIHLATFTYGPDNERKKIELMEGGEVKATRYYHGNYEELHLVTEDDDDNPIMDIYRIHYIGGGDGLCAIHVMVNNDTQGETYYVYKDHLGSILAITDDEGDLIAEQSFDAWGRYRSASSWAYSDGPGEGWPVWLSRGYTGHEHLPEFELVNMNGRMYDPLIARMLAPDNFVQDPHGTQTYNRYTYAFNNPLKYVDPDGENPAAIIAAIVISAVVNVAVNAAMGNIQDFGDFLGYAVIGAAAGAAGGAVGGAVSAALGMTSGFISGAVSGAASGAVSTGITATGNAYMQGASLKDGFFGGLQASLIGGAVGGVVGGISGAIQAAANGANILDGSTVNEIIVEGGGAETRAARYNSSSQADVNDELLKLRMQDEYGVSEGDFNIQKITTRTGRGYGLDQRGVYINTKSGASVGGYVRRLPTGFTNFHISPHYANAGDVAFRAVAGHELIHAYHRYAIQNFSSVFSERVAYKHTYDTYMSAGQFSKAFATQRTALFNPSGQFWGAYPTQYKIPTIFGW